jgi:hypothetical protein
MLISHSGLPNTNVLAFITDGLVSQDQGTGTQTLFEGEIDLQYSLTEQTFQMAMDLDPRAATSYYLVLVEENGASAEPNGQTGPPLQIAGTLENSYFANDGLAINPLKANRSNFPSPTIAFKLDGSQVPEPFTGMYAVLGIGASSLLRAIRRTPSVCFRMSCNSGLVVGRDSHYPYVRQNLSSATSIRTIPTFLE